MSGPTRTCVDCQKTAPEDAGDYTLISARFGWRLYRRKLDESNFKFEWRCPSCWAKFKAVQDAEAPPSSRREDGEPRPPDSPRKKPRFG